MQIEERRKLAGLLLALARRAGAAIMDIYAGDISVETKSDDSPLTKADGASEEIIAAGLAEIAPDIPLIAEEAAARGDIPDIGSRFFLVDPLDGTKEFINRNDEFTVNIALVEEGIPTLGVITAPALGRAFLAYSDGEAFESGLDGGDPTRLTTSCPQDGPRTAVASRSHRDEATNTYLEKLRISEVRSAGSSLKFCLVAAGQADIYPRFGPTCEWDTAAGHAILTCAGGCVTRLDGTPFGYGKSAERYLNPGFIAWGGGSQPPLPDI